MYLWHRTGTIPDKNKTTMLNEDVENEQTERKISRNQQS